MRALCDTQRAALAAAVEHLAWTVVGETLEVAAGTGPRSDLPDADQRQMWLAALNSLLAIRDAADQLAGSAALSAALRGADYPAIGDAAGMTRQGARRKWPGLAGLTDGMQRKLAWWAHRGDRFAQGVRAVLAAAEEHPEWSRPALLRERLDAAETASPTQRIDALDMLLVEAHAVAVGTPTPAEPGVARALGLLAAFTADAYAATNGHASLVNQDDRACATVDCHAPAIIELWRSTSDQRTAPACRGHAVEALADPAVRIVAAYRPDDAFAVFADAHGGR